MSGISKRRLELLRAISKYFSDLEATGAEDCIKIHAELEDWVHIESAKRLRAVIKKGLAKLAALLPPQPGSDQQAVGRTDEMVDIGIGWCPKSELEKG